MTVRTRLEVDLLLDELIDRIVADPAYADGTGKREDDQVSPAEAIAVMEDLYQAHDQADLVIPQVAAHLIAGPAGRIPQVRPESATHVTALVQSL